ncbi:MAG: 30S ribosomal protein S18 [Candidatus Stahlbacteria bacterium]|nr:30S ribosomal protein S18 [Candidatus Stahlbacteria bacterium]
MKKKRSPPRTKKYPERKKKCFFCSRDVPIDYKNVDYLKDYITKSGKILPRRITGICAKHQRPLAQAIMRARAMALLPYTKKQF